jgi:hypothetical protein
MQEPTQATQTNFVFLSLYLILLTFFIFLVSISVFEKTKTLDSMKSVKSVFLGKTNIKMEGKEDGAFDDGGNFTEELSGLFKNIFPETPVNVLGTGEYSEISIPSKLLFNPKTVNLLAPAESLLDQISALVTKYEKKQNIETTIYAATQQYDTKDNVFFGEKLPILQLGTLIKLISTSKDPTPYLSIGLKGGLNDNFQFVFRRFSKTNSIK